MLNYYYIQFHFSLLTHGEKLSKLENQENINEHYNNFIITVQFGQNFDFKISKKRSWEKFPTSSSGASMTGQTIGAYLRVYILKIGRKKS